MIAYSRARYQKNPQYFRAYAKQHRAKRTLLGRLWRDRQRLLAGAAR